MQKVRDAINVDVLKVIDKINKNKKITDEDSLKLAQTATNSKAYVATIKALHFFLPEFIIMIDNITGRVYWHLLGLNPRSNPNDYIKILHFINSSYGKEFIKKFYKSGGGSEDWPIMRNFDVILYNILNPKNESSNFIETAAELINSYLSFIKKT